MSPAKGHGATPGALRDADYLARLERDRTGRRTVGRDYARAFADALDELGFPLLPEEWVVLWAALDAQEIARRRASAA